ncbi:helix-turn-helix domain-containing protein [Anianabacter salinae]|uniref:helix-turn-helix domain-containing protein n=1 Tax=Anianabacter salinae TaxID=2851023 RepID=UPI00225E4D0D|nr:helix-turn-helix domain-containing protein [Anianabacter salinae]MBV0914232.1 helix-turn-helix domain-containing protein [Anianabacter salinae]
MESVEDDGNRGTLLPRTLSLIEALAVHGPTSLSDLCDIVGYPRVSVWRALRVLIKAKWVRNSEGPYLYELSAPLSTIMKSAHFAYLETIEIDSIVRWMKPKGIAVRAGLIHGSAVYTVIEPVGYVSDDANEQNSIHSNGTRAAILSSTREEATRFLDLYIRSEDCSDEDRNLIMSNAYFPSMLNDAPRGVFSHSEGDVSYIPTRFNGGSPGAIELVATGRGSAKKQSIQNLATVVREVEKIMESYSEDEQQFPTKGFIDLPKKLSGNMAGRAKHLLAPGAEHWIRVIKMAFPIK